MTAAALAQVGHSTHKPHGWLASLLVHVLAVGVSVSLFAEFKPSSQPEPFRWEIALAQVVPPPQVEPPTPVPPQPKRVIQPTPPAPRKPVETQPVIQRVQTVQTVQKVEQVVRQEQVAVQKVNPIVESIAQYAEPVRQERQTVKSTEAVQRAESVEAGPVAAVVTPTPVSQPASVSQTVQTEQAVHAEPAPVVSDVTTHRPAPVTTNEPVMAQAPAPIQQAVASQSAPQPVEAPAPIQQTARAAAAQPQAVERPEMMAAQTKADYSWLTQELLSRLERSKRYPYAARMNRWEGRVVVKAIVRDDGQVVSLQIAESSGHAILDNDAMELIREVSPLHLKHPLDKAQVALLVPVGYSLR